MRIKSKQFMLSLFLLCALISNAICSESETATLIIDVRVYSDPDFGGEWTNGYWITNIQTGKSFGGSVTSSSSLMVLEVPEGIYCVDELITGGHAIHFNYCGEPYFRVQKGIINNAGRWRFGITAKDRHYQLLSGAKEIQDVWNAAKKEFPDKFK